MAMIGAYAMIFWSELYLKSPRLRIRPANTQLGGRSMVEMLGVLAIIGVLSVGAIAGYQKAMLKYKLNKQTEQIGSMIDTVEAYANMWQNEKKTLPTNLNTILRSLNAIPQEMMKPGPYGLTYLYDVFNNKIQILRHEPNPLNPLIYFELIYLFDSASFTKEACINMLQIAKIRSSFLDKTGFCKGESVQTCGNTLYGNKSCQEGNNPCLKDLTLTQIEDLCTFCHQASRCYLTLIWGLD